MNPLKRLLKGGLRRMGLDLIRYRPLPPPVAQSLDPAADAIIAAALPYTMTSPERLYAVIRAVWYLVEHDIPGSIVECGVWRGGSMIAAAHALLSRNATTRNLYLFDTFEGMTEPTEADRTRDGTLAADRFGTERRRGVGSDWARATIEDVKDNVRTTGYPPERVLYVKGRVEETIPSSAPPAIALLRLDTDWYESTRHELEHLYPRLVSGGVLILDDYGHWLGARKAADEYFASRSILLNRIDDTGMVGVKP